MKDKDEITDMGGYGWVPCELEEAHQLPDGSRVYMCDNCPAIAGPGSELLDARLFNWVKWGEAMNKEQEEMKDEITDLGEAIVAIIQSPPGTWVDNSGSAWRFDESQYALQWLGAHDNAEKWMKGSLYVLGGSLPIRRIRYGWVPCYREEAHQMPDGSRAFMGKLWPSASTPSLSKRDSVDPGCTWVKWGKL